MLHEPVKLKLYSKHKKATAAKVFNFIVVEV